MTTRIDPRRALPGGGPAHKRRPIWRQRLVEAERGATQSFRGDSTFFAHFFAGTIVVAMAAVLGVSLMQWVAIILAATLVLSAELYHQMLKFLVREMGHHFAEPLETALRISAAAVLVTIAGAALTLALIFGQRVLELFRG